MPFRVRTRVGPKKYILGGEQKFPHEIGKFGGISHFIVIIWNIWRAANMSTSFGRWQQPCGLSQSLLQQFVRSTQTRHRKWLYWDISNIARLCVAARVIKTISTNNVNVRGVTSVEEQLFVLLQRNTNQVAVYSINNYRLLHHLHVPHFMPDNQNDLTSCRVRLRYKCLYMSDTDNECIHRYDLDTSVVNKWEVRSATPMGLSVTSSCTLLVICRWPNTLLELSAESGQHIREIKLKSDIVRPWHGVQSTTGQYVVCHGSYNSLHRACIVDDDGKVIRSYGDRCSNIDQLKMPTHAAVDKDSLCIFVADCFNNRVMLFGPTLEFVRYFSEGIHCPCRLHLRQTAARRLYVGQSYGDVAVLQL